MGAMDCCFCLSACEVFIVVASGIIAVTAKAGPHAAMQTAMAHARLFIGL